MIKKYIKGEPIMRNKVFEDNLVFIRSKIKERVCQYDTTATKNPMNLGQNIEHILLDFIDTCFNDVESTLVNQLGEEIKEWEHAEKRAYDMLSCYGVSKERAVSVDNGISVLASRTQKEKFFNTCTIDALRKQLEIATSTLEKIDAIGCESEDDDFDESKESLSRIFVEVEKAIEALEID